jgi:peptide chain release factor subunit 1
MADLDRSFLRKLAEWDGGTVPVTSVYLAVDGRRHPRKQDYLVQLEDLVRRVRARAEPLDRPSRRSVECDAGAIGSFVHDEFDRGPTRGLAVFASHGSGLWETITASRPFRNRAVVGSHPDLLPLEALLETYESFCSVLVDTSRARIFLAELGRIEERTELEDEVPGRHDQGGRSQARFQRHIDDHRARHLKRTADVLFRFSKRRSFDHLILGGPDEVAGAFEPLLHDYLKRKIRARISVPMTASASDVLARSLELEEQLERRRERTLVERLSGEADAGRRAVSGLAGTVGALAEDRVETLVVADGLAEPGVECPTCGWLSRRGRVCRVCGSTTRGVDDVVESAVARAYRLGCRVESVSEEGALAAHGGIGALLRF